MAEDSVVDEMADLGSGVSDQLSCTSVIFAVFFFNTALLFTAYKLLT